LDAILGSGVLKKKMTMEDANRDMPRAGRRLSSGVAFPWALAVGSLLLALAARIVLEPLLGSHLPYVSFFVAVTLTAYLATPAASAFVVIVGFLLAEWFFVLPRHSLVLGATSEIVGAVSYFVVSGSIAIFAQLASRARTRAEAIALELRQRQAQIETEIAERQRIELALRDSEARYRELVELAPDGVLVHQDLKIAYCNPAGLNLCRASRLEDLVGRDVLSIVHPADRDAVQRRVDVAEGGSRTALSEFRLIALDGTESIAEASGVRTLFEGRRSVLVVIRDVTERRRIQEALRESEARFRHLTQAIPGLVYDTDAFGQSAYFNSRWFEYTGKEAGEFEQRLQLVHPEDVERVRAEWDRAVQARSDYECEYRLRRHDGEYRWFLARAVPLRDAQSAAVRWFGVAIDVHEMKLAQQALRTADRNKNEFLAMLSHELRNPLTPIVVSLHILENSGAKKEAVERAVTVMKRQVYHLNALVDGLLDLTRISHNRVQLKKRVLDLREIASNVVEDHRDWFAACDVEIQLDSHPTPIYVDGDENRLTEVLGALLQNAAKFTPSGGRAWLSVSSDLVRGEAVLRVRDTGHGMTSDVLARLFQPFVQADTSLDRSKGGLGLGLAFAKGLVELHGGYIEAHSDGLGRGSEFVIRLPLERTNVELSRAKEPSLPARQRRVLIIEDNVDAAESLREALEFNEHLVQVAHNGHDGIVKAREFCPEVVLCDIGLPGMDGYEVARTIRADTELCHVFLAAVSGYARNEDLERARAAGFDRHLAKPPDLQKLEEIMSVEYSRGRAN
jgi:PAS domain S-box-containing protein